MSFAHFKTSKNSFISLLHSYIFLSYKYQTSKAVVARPSLIIFCTLPDFITTLCSWSVKEWWKPFSWYTFASKSASSLSQLWAKVSIGFVPASKSNKLWYNSSRLFKFPSTVCIALCSISRFCLTVTLSNGVISPIIASPISWIINVFKASLTSKSYLNSLPKAYASPTAPIIWSEIISTLSFSLSMFQCSLSQPVRNFDFKVWL